MLRDIVAKIVGKRSIDEKDFETRTTVGEPLKEKLKTTGDLAEPEWMKDMKK